MDTQMALTIQRKVVDAIKRGAKVEITTYPPLPATLFPNEEPGITQSTAYIGIEAYTPEEIEQACADVFGVTRWLAYKSLMSALRSNRKTIQNGDITT